MMFSQFRNVVEGLSQPRLLPPGAPRHETTNSVTTSPPAKPSAERSPFKAKLEDRLRASFTIGDVSNPSTPSASSRVSPAPQNDHPLSPDIDHPLSPISIPLPMSPPPHDHDFRLDTSHSPSDPSPLPLLDAADKPVPVVHGTSATLVLDSAIRHSLSDDPVIPQPSEKEPTPSEESIDVGDSTESTSTTGFSHSQGDTVSDTQSVAVSTQTDGHEPGFVSVLGNSSEPDSPSSVNVEALQEQLKLMEQRFAGKYLQLPSLNLFLNTNRRFCIVCEAASRKNGRR